MQRNSILEAQHVSKTFHVEEHQVKAVKDVSLAVRQGEILGIVGESGSGKSTMLKLLSGLKEMDEGEILFKGKSISSNEWKKKELYHQMQMVFQHPKEAFHPKKTIRKSIEEHMRNIGNIRDKKQMQERIAELFTMVGLKTEYADRYPHQLSGGQCQRAAIARAISCNPKLLLCDEVTSALDVITQQQIVNLLKELSEKMNLALVFVSHDLALVSSFCERIMVMNQGIVVEEGDTRSVLTNPQSVYTRKLLASVL